MAFTTTSSLDFAQTAYDRMAYFDLRPELYFDAAADIKPSAQSMPGATVVFTIVHDLAIASSPLNESTDVTPVAMSDSQVPVALAEFGNTVNTTAKLRGESFVEIDPVVANAIGYNAGVSIDEVARNIVAAGTNVNYAGAANEPGDDHRSRRAVGQERPLRQDLPADQQRGHLRRLLHLLHPPQRLLRPDHQRPESSPGVRRTTTRSPVKSGRARSVPSKASASSRRRVPRSTAVRARPRRATTPSGPCSSAARRWPRRTPTSTATARCPTWSPVRSPTTCAASSPGAGTGSATTACSVRPRCCAPSRVRAIDIAQPDIDT